MSASARCPFTCATCSRRCRAAQPFNHRFDCHGVIHAHVYGRGGWQLVAQPMSAGYLTGPSKTKAVA